MRWVAHARILTPDECAYIRKAAASRPKAARAWFARLLEIRELIWMIATALAEQRPVGEKLRAALTAAHAEACDSPSSSCATVSTCGHGIRGGTSRPQSSDRSRCRP
jgi:hypothetical protein